MFKALQFERLGQLPLTAGFTDSFASVRQAHRMTRQLVTKEHFAAEVLAVRALAPALDDLLV